MDQPLIRRRCATKRWPTRADLNRDPCFRRASLYPVELRIGCGRGGRLRSCDIKFQRLAFYQLNYAPTC